MSIIIQNNDESTLQVYTARNGKITVRIETEEEYEQRVFQFDNINDVEIFKGLINEAIDSLNLD